MRGWWSFLVFLAIFSAVVGSLHAYLFHRLVRGPQLPARSRRAMRALFGFGALLVPTGIVASQLLPPGSARPVAFAAFGWLGFVVVAFFLSLGTEPLRLFAALADRARGRPADPTRRTVLSRLLAGGVAGLTGVGGVAGLSSALGEVEIRRVPLQLARWPAALGGYRIAHLTDVHVGPTIDGRWLRGVVERTNALEPDLVAITGDLVDGTVEELREHVAPLAELRARHGVFFVTGNHEYYSGADAWIAELERLGIRVLRNERVPIGDGEAGFDLAGVDDWTAARFGGGHGADLGRALAGRDPSREVVLLAHQPKQALEAARLGVGLQLSGHTHGGQIFPWGLFVRLDQPFVAGLGRLADLLVYTSCGTGYWGPPMRIGAPAEIALLEIEARA